MVPVIGTCLMAALLAAPADPELENGETGRRLGGHDFILTDVVPDPFVTTQFRSSTGLGLVALDAGAAMVQAQRAIGDNSSGHMQVAWFEQQIGFQAAVLPFLAVRVNVAGLVGSGVDATSALVFGVKGGYQFDGGATASLRLGPVCLGASFDLAYERDFVLSPLLAIAQAMEAVKNSQVPSISKLFNDSSDIRVQPGLRAAVGVNRTFGLFANAGLDYDGAVSGGVPSATTVQFGAGLSIDLNPGLSVPIGFLVAYEYETAVDSSSIDRHTVSAGIFYTGRPHLQLGLEAQGAFYPVSGFDSVSQGLGEVTVRYFW